MSSLLCCLGRRVKALPNQSTGRKVDTSHTPSWVFIDASDYLGWNVLRKEVTLAVAFRLDLLKQDIIPQEYHRRAIVYLVSDTPFYIRGGARWSKSLAVLFVLNSIATAADCALLGCLGCLMNPAGKCKSVWCSDARRVTAIGSSWCHPCKPQPSR